MAQNFVQLNLVNLDDDVGAHGEDTLPLAQVAIGRRIKMVWNIFSLRHPEPLDTCYFVLYNYSKIFFIFSRSSAIRLNGAREDLVELEYVINYLCNHFIANRILVNRTVALNNMSETLELMRPGLVNFNINYHFYSRPTQARARSVTNRDRLAFEHQQGELALARYRS